ncbi:MAG TPA: hypothetical protein VFZ21_15460 [Gemmatimonadaceae bacterium]|nr:hypothetical protein [Gemmatimonadaceae bacterium]
MSGSPRDREAIQQIVDTFDQTWGVDAATYALNTATPILSDPPARS